MSHRTLNQLPEETIKLITSTQIITSVSTAVKELVENSLDADSRNIQVKLENYGFDVLEVKDDGYGISYSNVQKMFLPGYTSKITCFDDLERLESYGFRGEALNSLAQLSNVFLTTKTNDDTLAMTYTINNEGIPVTSKPSHIVKGTIICAKDLFKNVPVRRKYLSSKKKVSEELKKVEFVVQSLSAIHPELRLSLIHNKCTIWQKNSVKGIKQSFMQIVGLKAVSKMEHLNEVGNNILVDLIIPKKSLDNIDNLLTNCDQNIFTYVNKRPVVLTKVSKVVVEHIFLHYTKLSPSSKYSICFISLEIPPQEIDVNLEPNKTKIFLKNETEVINLIDHILSSYYEQSISRFQPDEEKVKTDENYVNEEMHELDKMDFFDESESLKSKRPRIEKENYEENEIIVEKNNEWNLIVLSDDNSHINNSTTGLCSQINKQNCILTTNEEVGELKKLLNINNQKLVAPTNLESEMEHIDRNDLQNHNELKINEKTSCNTSNAEKPILPDWPVRVIPQLTKIPDKVSLNENIKAVEDSSGLMDNSIETDLLPLDSLDNIDVSEWSKGVVETKNGLLQGGITLARPGYIDKNFEVVEDDIEQFDLSMRSISSQMGKKELSAFTKYARIMRPKILEEFPGIIFTKVAGLLVDRWRALGTEEKNYYDKLCKAVDIKREIREKQKTLDNFEGKTKITKKLKDKDKKPERLTLTIPVSLENIVGKKESSFKDFPNRMEPIGQLQPSGNWLYKKGLEIGHVRHCGLHEQILSQRMLSTHSVPKEPTPKPILINEDILGKEHWQILIGLEKEYDPLCSRYTIVSPVISKNGFKIDLEKTGDVFRLGWITEVASMIPFYGVSELKNTLNLYNAKDEYADLSSFRSAAVINYITNEAIRIVHQTPRPPDLKDLKEWLETWEMCFNHSPAQCLHGRDIFVPIHRIERNHPKS